MQSKTTVQNGVRVARGFGGTLSQTPNVAVYTNQFTVTNFGPGDHVRATEGSFSKSQTWHGFGYSRTVNHKNGTWSETSGAQPIAWETGLPVWNPDYSTSQLQALCIIALYEQLQDRKFDFGVTAGESKQTKRMIDKAVKGVFGLVSTARKIRKSVARFDTKAFANAWLEYTYGWVPLCMDIYNLAHFTATRWKEHTVRASRSSVKPVTAVFYRLGNENFPVTITGVKSNRVRYQMTVRAKDQEAYDLSRLGSMDPRVIAWELMPYSFVVDWVWDIGGYLAAQETALLRGLEFVRGHYTITTLSEYRRELRGRDRVTTPTFDQSTTMMMVGGNRSVTKSRTRLASQPIVRIPPVKVNMGTKRIFSAAALLRQVMR